MMTAISCVFGRAAAVGCVLLMGACSDGTSRRDGGADADSADELPDAVYLRLRNGSDVSFDTIIVSVGEPIDFGALPARADSEYLPADGIYSYAYIEGASGEARVTHQPTDYIGETPLGPGYYTYVLSVTPNPDQAQGGSFNIRLIRDPVPE